jgi:hypothetical protein
LAFLDLNQCKRTLKQWLKGSKLVSYCIILLLRYKKLIKIFPTKLRSLGLILKLIEMARLKSEMTEMEIEEIEEAEFNSGPFSLLTLAVRNGSKSL